MTTELLKLVKKIMCINDYSLYLDILQRAGAPSITMEDLIKNNVYEDDIIYSIQHFNEKEIIDLQAEVKKYRSFTAMYNLSGMKKIYAKSKEEAFKNAKVVESKDINWSLDMTCFRIAPSRYVHEFRVMLSGQAGVRYWYAYDKSDEMTEIEVKEYLNQLINETHHQEYCVEYIYIVDSKIYTKKEYCFKS